MTPTAQPIRQAPAPPRPADPARILLVEDEALMRNLMRHQLRLAFPGCEVGEADCVATAQEMLLGPERGDAEPWDILILDLLLRGRSGHDILDFVRNLAQPPPVLLLTSQPESMDAARGLAGGALGYLTKDAGIDEVLRAVAAVARGERCASEAALRLLRQAQATTPDPSRPPHELLTSREREILRLFGARGGGSVGQIARILNLSEKTVSTHRANILRKMNLESTGDLIRYAVENKL